jgi:hypothetical protein
LSRIKAKIPLISIKIYKGNQRSMLSEGKRKGHPKNECPKKF